MQVRAENKQNYNNNLKVKPAKTEPQNPKTASKTKTLIHNKKAPMQNYADTLN